MGGGGGGLCGGGLSPPISILTRDAYLLWINLGNLVQ